MEFITQNPSENKAVIRELVKGWEKKKRSGALVLGLEGELGSGKTTFLQGMTGALGVKEKVLSPTFVIMKKYGIPANPGGFKNFYHFDCYRLEDSKEILALGFEEIIKEGKNLVAIEWAEKIKDILPKDAVWIKFEHLGEERRRIKIKM